MCQGLRNVFEFVGGVPARAVFDNATEVGRRVCGEVRPGEMLGRFSAHYCLDHTFTNPYSGNEKGNVEAKVGYHRRNLFVPVPQMHDAEAFNERLLRDSLDMSAEKRHHRLGVPELELFGEDRAALAELPPVGYQCVRWETRRCSKQGVFTLGGIHRYSAGPAYAGKEVAVAVGAFRVRVVDEGTGEVVAEYEREWGSVPTDSSDPVLQLRPLCMRPAGWRDSVVRQSLPRELVELLDGEGGADLGRDLRVLRDASAQHGWQAAVRGMEAALRATGGVDGASVELSAAVAASGGTRVEYDEEPDLGEYDRAVGLAGGVVAGMQRSEREATEEAFRAAARALFISGETIDGFVASATPGQLSACRSMLEAELVHRDRAKRQRLPGQARFPVPKSFDGFDWSNVSFPDGWGREDMLSLSFMECAEDLVFYGPTGRGKTHVATAVGMAAVSAGHPVRFWQTAQLVLQLGKAKREGTLDRLLSDVAKARLLVLDEFGYVPFDVDGARLLYQVISESHGRRSVIFTTNVEFSRWGTVFADDKLAAAIVDRVVHHGRLVEFGGPSHRLEESLMLGKSGR